MTRSRLNPAAVCALAVIAGALAPPATPAAPVPKHLAPKEEPLWYPTRIGDRREFVEGKRTTVSIVAKVEKTPDGTTVWMEHEDGEGKRYQDQVVRFSPKGVEVLEFGSNKLDPTFWWFKLPHVANNTWPDRYASQGWTGKTVWWEEIEVPAGKFKALRVQHIDAAPAVRTTDYWFSPGLGCIKWWDGTCGHELKSFTPGK